MNRLLLLLCVLFLSSTSFANKYPLTEVEKNLTPKLLSYYKAVVFVNAATSGTESQKMWVFERNEQNDFAISLWNTSYWAQKGLASDEAPEYSWLVSTGRKYPGEAFSGPTILGIFNLADQKTAWDPARRTVRTRWHKDYYAPGMYDALFLDYGYSSHRLTGIAFHGTTPSRYKNLGKADSHGCVRLHQEDSEKFWHWFHDPSMTSEIPSFWQNNKTLRNGYQSRTRYVKNGQLQYDSQGNIKTHIGRSILVVIFHDSSSMTPYDLDL